LYCTQYGRAAFGPVTGPKSWSRMPASAKIVSRICCVVLDWKIRQSLVWPNSQSQGCAVTV
jgi:hypothetical protein